MKKWYACYTKPRAEKATQLRLNRSGITCYLPLRKERRRWSDRLKTITVPLFTSYIFVNIEEHEFNKTRIEGELVGFISFGGKPVSIPENQIETIKLIAINAEDVEVVPSNILPGEKIQITGGALIGVLGELVRHQGNHKVLVRLAEIGQGVLFTIDKNMIALAI
jgi:transcription antitermination factor NusG